MNDVPIVFLTALNLEYSAVRTRLVDIRAHQHPKGTRFEVGRLAGTAIRAGVALVGKGNQPAAVLAERAIAEFSPRAVVFVGVAGALRSNLALGDVVVATHVYAYHGGTSEDDGLKARPRVWEASHEAEQLARAVELAGTWAGPGVIDGQCPRVHFGPIAAGEVVQDSAVSDQARWMRQHYNDALAIDMEAAGLAQAGHLNKGLPVIVVRGISDRADGTKADTDAGNWQPRAVDNAAAFAVALAAELSATAETDSPNADRYAPAPSVVQSVDPRTSPQRVEPGTTVTNIASTGSRVGVQASHVYGDIRVGAESGRESERTVPGQLAALRGGLRQAHRAGDLDDETYAAAEVELDLITSLLSGDRTRDGGIEADRGKVDATVMVALKRLRGLVADVADLTARVAVIVTAVRAMS